MTFIENKKKMVLELKTRHKDAKIVSGDSILIKKNGLITKIPMRRCTEEVFILRKFKDLGIPTVDIEETGEIDTNEDKIPCFTMVEIENSVNLITYGNRFLNKKYYSFLKSVLGKLKKVRFSGYGALTLTESGLKTEFHSEINFLQSVIDRAEKRGYWPPFEIERLRKKTYKLEESNKGILVHTDILNNVLVQDNGVGFYLIDPQTIVSSANEYWDLSYYLVYANCFGCTRGLKNFLENFTISNCNKFLLTTEINAYERASFYATYEQSKLQGILSFISELKANRILVGNKSLSIENLSSKNKA